MRAFAAFLCVPIGLFGLWASLWVFLGVAVTSEPFLPAGDPCCTYPQNWDEIWDGARWSVMAAWVVGAIFFLALTLATYAMSGRFLGWVAALSVPGACALLVAIILAALLYPVRDDPRLEGSSNVSRIASK